jgi:hypothetical protein
MQITEAQLGEATRRGLLSVEQARALWTFLAEDARQRGHDTPSFKPAHILYYLGGMIAIGAMTLFMTLGWETFGGGGLLVVSLVYATAALLLTEYLLERKHLALPAGITAVLAVVMVPLAVYGAQNALGYWSDDGHASAYRDYHRYIDWRWMMMEFATLIGAAIALWRYRLPFLVMPVAVTLWYMSMDLVPMLLGGDSHSFFSELGRFISLWFGLLMTLLAFWVDLRTRHTKDFAFWLYLFGVITFWGALSSMDSGSEFGKLIYCAINVGLIAIGAALSRRIFAVCGGLGLAGYLGHLSYTVFKDSLMFPLALTAIGLGVVGVGIWWQRNEAAIGTALRAWLPTPMRELVQQRRS